jgi:hypothetical protein
MAAAAGEFLFDVTLRCHIAAGLTAVISGAVAMTAPKRPGRHPRAGNTYAAAMAVVFATATTMALLRLGRDWHLLLIATAAASATATGWLARRRRRRGWLRVHILGMGVSYIALLTGFYVDNGPNLPLWNRLPSVMFWLLPSLIGVPLLRRALAKRHLSLRLRPGWRGWPGSGEQPGRPGQAE